MMDIMVSSNGPPHQEAADDLFRVCGLLGLFCRFVYCQWDTQNAGGEKKSLLSSCVCRPSCFDLAQAM